MGLLQTLTFPVSDGGPLILGSPLTPSSSFLVSWPHRSPPLPVTLPGTTTRRAKILLHGVSTYSTYLQ